LESLKDLKELRSLNISNTDIEGGLESIVLKIDEYQLSHIYCSNKERQGSKVSEVENKLKESSKDFESSHDGSEYTRNLSAQE